MINFITNYSNKHRYNIINWWTVHLICSQFNSLIKEGISNAIKTMRKYYKIILDCFGSPLEYTKLIYGNTMYAYNVASRMRNFKYKFKSRQEKVLLLLCEKHKQAGLKLDISEIIVLINEDV